MKKIAKLIIPALAISLLVGCNPDSDTSPTKDNQLGGNATRPSYWDDSIVPIKPTGSDSIVDPSINPSTDPTVPTEPSSSSKPGGSTKPSSGTSKPSSSTTTKPTTSSSTTKPKPTRPSNSAGKLEFSVLGSFSGMYPESGEYEYVENVLALYVTNISTDYLEHAYIYYNINDAEAVFVVEGLQPGKSAWVMERTKMKVDANITFAHSGDQSAFQVDNQIEAKDIEVKMDSGFMYVTNRSENDLKNVVVRYKELWTDQKTYPGVYSGGIVYNVRVGDLKAGQSVKASAEHCKPTGFEVVRIDWS